MPDLLEELGKYREKDEKTPQGEVIQDKETLNFARIRKYLDKKGITEANFDTLFKLPTALEILREGGTKGEQEMIRLISEGQNYLTKVGEPELMERENVASFSSTAKKELITRNELDKLPMLEEAFRAYDTVRQLARRSLATKRQLDNAREAQKVSVEKGLKDTLSGVLDDVKRNFANSSSGEKAVMVGSVLLGAIVLFTSDNKHVEKIKNVLWSVTKAAGVGIGANYIYKLFTGKTALDAISDATKDTVGRPEYWKDIYKTDAEKAAIMEKSVVYLGNKDFLDLAAKYKTAKSSTPPQTEIRVPGVTDKEMPPKEIYIALDVFFSKYPVENLEPRFRNARPALNWATVVAAMMTEDNSITMSGNLPARTVDNVKEYAIRGWNAFWVNEAGFGLNRYLYKKVWGKEPTEQEIKTQTEKLRAHLEDEVNSESDVDKFLDRAFGATRPEHAGKFKQMRKENKRDSQDHNVSFMEVPNDSIYLMSEAKLDATVANDKGVEEMLNNALKQAENFLKRKYPDLEDNLYRFIDIEEMRGVRVAENSTFKLFIRMPVKGSPEYSHKSVLLPSPGAKDKPGEDVFGPADRIEYAKLEDYQKEGLRIAFRLDSNQIAEFDKICQWFTETYKNQGISRREVIRIMTGDEKVRRKAVEQTAVKQNLKANESLYLDHEKDLDEMEKDAASAYEGKDAFGLLLTHMKKEMGNKVRLAILGDVSARNHFIGIDARRYDPSQNEGWLSDLTGDYKKKCKKTAEEYMAGRLNLA